jgi:hypothetical protein
MDRQIIELRKYIMEKLCKPDKLDEDLIMQKIEDTLKPYFNLPIGDFSRVVYTKIFEEFKNDKGKIFSLH